MKEADFFSLKPMGGRHCCSKSSCRLSLLNDAVGFEANPASAEPPQLIMKLKLCTMLGGSVSRVVDPNGALSALLYVDC